MPDPRPSLREGPDSPADPVAEELFLIRAAVERGVVKPATVRSLLAAVEAVLALHAEFRVYEECGRQHACDGVIDCGDFITCEDGYLYSVCRDCCTGGRDQTEECAGEHDRASCWPCPTREAISRALLGEGETGAV